MITDSQIIKVYENMEYEVAPSYVDESLGDCYICTSYAKNSVGYPSVRNYEEDKRDTVARAMYEVLKGSVAPGKVVRHKCDNRACFNVDHLEVGSQSDNIMDSCMRRRYATGTKHPNSKLSVNKVRAIRILHDSFDFSKKDLGKMFGVSSAMIYKIVNNIAWRFDGNDLIVK